MVTVLRRSNVQILGVETVPQPVEQIMRERPFQVELDDFAVSHDPELPGIGISERLNIAPAPASPVTAVLGDVIDTVLAQSQRSVAASETFPVMCRNLGDDASGWVWIAVDDGPPDVLREAARDIRRHRLAQCAPQPPFSCVSPVAAVLCAGTP